MWKICANAYLEEEDGEAILFDSDSLKTLWLNETSILIWRSLSKGKDFDGIVSDLLNTFEVTQGEAETDLRIFIDELEKFGWIASN